MQQRESVLHWIDKGFISRRQADTALKSIGIPPTQSAWNQLLDKGLLVLGVLFLATGSIFFIAYNWTALGKFARLVMVDAALVSCVAFAHWRGLDTAGGKAAITLACALVGGLLALIGQTYQTGADPWQLFAFWSVLILPWAFVARVSGIWFGVALLANLALLRYMHVAMGLFGIGFSEDNALWWLFGLTTLTAVIWEMATRWQPFLGCPPWPQILHLGVIGWSTALATISIFDGGPGILAWLLSIGIFAWYYLTAQRHRAMLAMGLLSTIYVLSAALARVLFKTDVHAGGLLVMAVFIIGLSAAGAAWLQRLGVEDDA